MSSSLFRSDTLPAVSALPPPPSTGQSAVYRDISFNSATTAAAGTGGAYKRGASAERERDPRRRGTADDGKPPGKRARDHSPPPHLAGRERDRYGLGGRRYGSPAGWADRDRFDRDKDRSRSPARGTRGGAPQDREREKERAEPPKPPVPPVVSWFVGQLPPPATFDGMSLSLLSRTVG